MASTAAYDRIGRGYAARRQPDPRIAAQVLQALGSARRVVNVGAGAGSYEPDDRMVVAVEPSAVMRAQRPDGAAPCVDAVVGALPFASETFDVAMAVLSVHHWPDQRAGLDELRRVAARQVVLTFDPGFHDRFWMVREYLPESAHLRGSTPMAPELVAEHLGGGEVHVVPVPDDCRDGFYWAYWKRPDAYLDPSVQASISGIAQLPAELVAERMARLAADLASGRWAARHGDLVRRSSVDGGYRLVVAGHQ